MPELTGIFMAADARRSIGKRQDRSGKNQRLHIDRKNDDRVNDREPDHILVCGTDVAARIIRRIALAAYEVRT